MEGAGSYRPRYELVAEQILELIAELGLRPGDRMPTENELAGRLGVTAPPAQPGGAGQPQEATHAR